MKEIKEFNYSYQKAISVYMLLPLIYRRLLYVLSTKKKKKKKHTIMVKAKIY